MLGSYAVLGCVDINCLSSGSCLASMIHHGCTILVQLLNGYLCRTEHKKSGFCETGSSIAILKWIPGEFVVALSRTSVIEEAGRPTVRLFSTVGHRRQWPEPNSIPSNTTYTASYLTQ